jgi:hypothetical protein
MVQRLIDMFLRHKAAKIKQPSYRKASTSQESIVHQDYLMWAQSNSKEVMIKIIAPKNLEKWNGSQASIGQTVYNGMMLI